METIKTYRKFSVTENICNMKSIIAHRNKQKIIKTPIRTATNYASALGSNSFFKINSIKKVITAMFHATLHATYDSELLLSLIINFLLCQKYIYVSKCALNLALTKLICFLNHLNRLWQGDWLFSVQKEIIYLHLAKFFP